MPTTVTSSIGTASRTYSTVQLWEDACPANLVTDDKIWKGECYNDSEFTTAATLVTFSGTTMSATQYPWLTCAAGHSYLDHAGLQTNRPVYDQSKGVGLRSTNGFTWTTASSGNVYPRMTGLQISGAVNQSGVGGGGHSGGVLLMERCIVEGSYIACIYETTGVVTNTIFIARGAGTHGIGLNIGTGGHARLINCTIVCPSDLTSTKAALKDPDAGYASFSNCAIFGFGSMLDVGAGLLSHSSHNASDLAITFGTDNQASKTFSSQFENINNATLDLRLKTGADCVNTGLVPMTEAAVAYWNADEASGNLLDSIGSNNLTDTNTVGSATGALATARDFVPGNTEYFTIATNSTLNLGTSEWTLSTWVYADDVATQRRIMGKGSTDTEFALDIQSDGKLRIKLCASAGGAGSNTTTTNSSLTAATWYHVLLKMHNFYGDVIFYLNGATNGFSMTHTTGLYVGAEAFEMGTVNAGTDLWDGRIDETLIVKRWVDGWEIQSLYGGGTPPPKTLILPMDQSLNGQTRTAAGFDIGAWEFLGGLGFVRKRSRGWAVRRV